MSNDIDRCESCEWILEMELDANNFTNRTYICRESPPTVNMFPVPMPNGEIALSSQSTYPSIMPKMASCGKYFFRNGMMLSADTINKDKSTVQ